jgi:hypothetical protein
MKGNPSHALRCCGGRDQGYTRLSGGTGSAHSITDEGDARSPPALRIRIAGWPQSSWEIGKAESWGPAHDAPGDDAPHAFRMIYRLAVAASTLAINSRDSAMDLRVAAVVCENSDCARRAVATHSRMIFVLVRIFASKLENGNRGICCSLFFFRRERSHLSATGARLAVAGDG